MTELPVPKAAQNEAAFKKGAKDTSEAPAVKDLQAEA
jgi:hypothetical protein